MKRHFVNDDYFSKIDSESKAYLLGFFIADGCIGMNEGCKNSYFMQLNICYDDHDILEWVQKEICPENKITVTNYQGGGVKHRRPVGKIKWTSNKMKDDLYSYGIHMRKTYESDFVFPMERIPDEFIWDFIRGFMDGDGCVGLNSLCTSLSFTFCSTAPEFLKQLGERFKSEFGIEYYIIDQTFRTTPLYYLNFRAKSNKAEFIKNVYLKLYKDKTYFLKRKKDKFDKYLQVKYRVKQMDCERPSDNVERS